MCRPLLVALFLLGTFGCESVPPIPSTSACSSDSQCPEGLQCMALSGCNQDEDGNGVADIVDSCEAAAGSEANLCADSERGALSECMSRVGLQFCDRDLNANGHPDLIDLGMHPAEDCSVCTPSSGDFYTSCNPACFTIIAEATMTPPSEGSDDDRPIDSPADQAPPSDPVGGGCSSLIVSGGLVWNDSSYEVSIGNSEDDMLDLSFFSSLTGTFDLASDANANYLTCDQCLLAFKGTTTYFQRSGSLTLSPDSLVEEGIANVTLSEVILEEITIDEDYVSTPVPNGDCLQLSSPITLVSP